MSADDVAAKKIYASRQKVRPVASLRWGGAVGSVPLWHDAKYYLPLPFEQREICSVDSQ